METETLIALGMADQCILKNRKLIINGITYQGGIYSGKTDTPMLKPIHGVNKGSYVKFSEYQLYKALIDDRILFVE